MLILEYIDDNRPHMLEMLEHVVNIDSGSRYKEGVDRVTAFFARELENLGFEMKDYPHPDLGITRVGHRKGSGPKIVLMGHCDTVFPAGTAAKRPFRRDGEYAYGPGVVDMKAGMVMAVYGLKALLEHGHLDVIDTCFILVPDEEIGSPSSRAIIEDYARDAYAVLNLEPGYKKDGDIVTKRKGVAWFSIEVKGRAAHAGTEPEKGRNAINALIKILPSVQVLQDLEKGTTINIGTIEGGVVTNMVAPSAAASVDMRFEVPAEWDRVKTWLDSIAGEKDGIRVAWSGGVKYVPMERTPGVVKLYEVVKRAGEELGVSLRENSSGGGADSGFTAALGVPTICAVGPYGGNMHSPEEFLYVPSLPERTKLFALIMLELKRRPY